MEGRPRRFPPNDEGVEKDTGGFQPGEGGLAHLQGNLHEPQTFLLLAYLKLP
jgi:hypothetical protein